MISVLRRIVQGALGRRVILFVILAEILFRFDIGLTAEEDGGNNNETSSQISSITKKAVPNLAIFQEGEELTYEVSFFSVRLGSITSRIVDVDTTKTGILYKTECLIRSYKGIPFVNLHTLFQSTVDDSLSSVSFSAKERYSDTMYKYINYTFPKKKNVVYISERIGNEPILQNYDTLILNGKKWQDGLSLLFYARACALKKGSENVPVLIYRSKASTLIRFGVGEEPVEIDAVDYPVHTVKLDGETGFTGIFGLTGEFEGWFSRDEACVPIYAKMHVLIGSVRLELIEWKKKGWMPPRYQK